MSTSNTLVPKTIVDKNGHTTTRMVNPDKRKKSSRPPLDVLYRKPPSAATLVGRFNDAVRERARVHAEIAARYANGEDYTALVPLIDARNSLDKLVQNFKDGSRDDGLPVPVTDIKIPSHFIENSEDRVGYSNDYLSIDTERDVITAVTVEVSAIWLDSVSSAEAVALIKYAGGGSTEYAKEVASGSLSPVWDDLEAAVAHAPVVEPFVAYTGVNEYYVNDMLAQAESTGVVVLDRVFSSSLNPAQVNGFANGERKLSLEVETTKGTFMDVISHVPDEMEVMLPKGRYEVLETMDNVSYLWSTELLNGGKYGRTMDKTLRLRYLGE